MGAGQNACASRGGPALLVGDHEFVPGYRADGSVSKVSLYVADMTPEERAIVKAGCLINYNRQKNA